MGFIEREDFKGLITSDSLEVIDTESLSFGIRTAIQTLRDYLSSICEMDRVLEKSADQRHQTLLTCALDIALWHAMAHIATADISENRKHRYDHAMDFLSNIREGFIKLEGLEYKTTPSAQGGIAKVKNNTL